MNNKSYIIISNMLSFEVEKEVINKLHDGYTCVGGVSMLIISQGIMYSQAMILKSLL